MSSFLVQNSEVCPSSVDIQILHCNSHISDISILVVIAETGTLPILFAGELWYSENDGVLSARHGKVGECWLLMSDGRPATLLPPFFVFRPLGRRLNYAIFSWRNTGGRACSGGGTGAAAGVAAGGGGAAARWLCVAIPNGRFYHPPQRNNAAAGGRRDANGRLGHLGDSGGHVVENANKEEIGRLGD